MEKKVLTDDINQLHFVVSDPRGWVATKVKFLTFYHPAPKDPHFKGLLPFLEHIFSQAPFLYKNGGPKKKSCSKNGSKPLKWGSLGAG